MDKKSRKMGTGNARIPSPKIQEKGGLIEVCNTTIDSILGNEMLVSIFEFLPAAYRMRLELVSKKWNRLASKWAWSNYTILSIKQFPGCDKWNNTCAKFNSLFLRCGKFIKELDFSRLRRGQITSDHLCGLLPLLPNLRHLNLGAISLSTAALTLIADTFPDLISLRFMCPTSDNFDGITSVLNKCKKLEILLMYDGGNLHGDVYYFVVLPPTLKCVYIGGFFDYRSFFLQVVEQDIHLESLELSASFKFDIFSFDVINFGRLKYLALTLEWIIFDLNNFSRSIENLSHLEALDLISFDDAEVTWTDLLFEVIANKCTSLKHLGLNLYVFHVVNSEKLALLADLPNLCSVYVHLRSSAGPIPISALFQKLSLSGQLQYFNTNGVLVLEDVSQALVRCENLTRIFCGQSEVEEDQQRECFDLLLSTLEIIHEGQQLPATPNDGRILHTNFGNHNKKNFLRHPWVRFYENHGQFPLSKVREEVYLAGVSSKPNSW